MKSISLISIFFFLWLAVHVTQAQKPIVNNEIRVLMKQAIEEMRAKEYQRANTTFRQMLASKKVLPTNMSYLFAETLFMIKQYHNSENFLSKYLELAGKGGDYYEQAVQLQALIEEKKNEIKTCQLCNVFGYKLDTCQLCQGLRKMTVTCHYCKGTGISNCITCQGKGVIITKNIFNVEEYKSCHVCDTKGFVTCPVCDNKKVIDRQCTDCLGSGLKETREICDHQIPPKEN